MYHRLLSWLVFGAFVAVSALRAQAPASASPAGAPPPGLVLVAQVRGTVTKTFNGQVTPLKINDSVEQTAKVITARDSSVVLVFSNGATTQLGDDTEMVLEQFLQDPFGSEMKEMKVADLQEEPTRSNTRLNLHRGELVGKVARLRHDRGSTFIVQTPVGAAGIRGTTFRIVFRPQGTGQAFFQLSTVEGNVNFNQGAPGAGPGAGAAAAPGQGQPQDPGTAPGAQGAAQPQGGTPAAAPAGGVPVVGGQEVVIQVDVNVSTTGQLVVSTPPPPVTATVPISAAVQNQIVQQAQNIAVAVATTVFSAPPAPTPGAPAAGGTPAPGGAETPSQTPSGTTGTTGVTGTVSTTAGAGGQTTPSGTTTAVPGTTATKGTAGTAGQSGTTPATPPTVASAPPPPIAPPPKLTPGDGRPGG